MRKTYRVTIQTKKGGSVAALAALRTAIYGTAPHCDDYKDVEVAERMADEVKAELFAPLYALGRKDGGKWLLIDYFNSKKKAANAVKKSVENYKKCDLRGEFAILGYSGITREWELDGEPAKA